MKITKLFKKYWVPAAALFIGLFIGFILFNSNNNEEKPLETNETNSKVYTCSMHPSIKQGKQGDCPLCGMSLVMMQKTDNSLLKNQFSMSRRALELASIETSIIDEQIGKGALLRLSGKITSNERTNATQTTLFDGRLDKLDVKTVGDYVRKGAQIGVMYSPDMYLAQDKLLTSSSYKDTHQKLYAAARNTLGLWKLNDNQIEELLKTGKPIINFPLYADVSGTVTEVMASEGGYYKEGDPLYKVSQLSKVWAVFDVYENDLAFLKVGQTIKIKASALKEKSIQGKIDFIEPVVDVSKRVVAARVELDNKHGELKPGMFIEGFATIENSKTLVMVPKSAVLWTGKRSVVYKKVSKTEPVFEIANIQLGENMGDNYIVLDGLNVGDEIVTNGTFTVDASAQLQGKKSMLSEQESLHGHTQQLSFDDASVVTPEYNERVKKVLNAYFIVKDALVSTSPKKVKKFASQMEIVLKNIKTNLLSKDAANRAHEMLKDLQQMASTENIDKQRKAFSLLSEHIIYFASTHKELEKPIYIQHCPMANSNKGANWISLEETIKNPYYGDAMLSCGFVKKVID